MDETRKAEEMSYFELLAWLGFGSAHPGGFSVTRQNLSTLNIKPGDHVLDAGCGSGLTACYLARITGSSIIGIDINPLMIEKAVIRAEKENVSHLVEFRAADVYTLPFRDNSFDWVITESVTIFLDKDKAFREFYRVLKPQGQLADLELALLREIPPNLRGQLEECFGQGTDPLSFEQWCRVLSQAGFKDVQVRNPQNLKIESLVGSEMHQDWLLFRDLEDKIKKHPGLKSRLQKNAGFIYKHQSYFGYGLFYGRKPETIPAKQGLRDLIRKITFNN